MRASDMRRADAVQWWEVPSGRRYEGSGNHGVDGAELIHSEDEISGKTARSGI